MRFIAALFITIVLACAAHGQELTCKMHADPTNSVQLDLDEGAATAFWHGGGSSGISTQGTGSIPAKFTSDKITWKYTEDDDTHYEFELFRMTGVLWLHGWHYTSKGWAVGNTVWDCDKSERKF